MALVGGILTARSTGLAPYYEEQRVLADPARAKGLQSQSVADWPRVEVGYTSPLANGLSGNGLRLIDN